MLRCARRAYAPAPPARSAVARHRSTSSAAITSSARAPPAASRLRAVKNVSRPSHQSRENGVPQAAASKQAAGGTVAVTPPWHWRVMFSVARHEQKKPGAAMAARCAHEVDVVRPGKILRILRAADHKPSVGRARAGSTNSSIKSRLAVRRVGAQIAECASKLLHGLGRRNEFPGRPSRTAARPVARPARLRSSSSARATGIAQHQVERRETILAAGRPAARPSAAASSVTGVSRS